jgi:uncharacterized membrane protein YdbT with pleckstrin-like domain
VYTFGIISKHQRVIGLQRVQDVGVFQGLVARIFGYGDLLIESAGETGQESIKYLSRVRGARDAILVAVNEGQEREDGT